MEDGGEQKMKRARKVGQKLELRDEGCKVECAVAQVCELPEQLAIFSLCEK